MLHQVFPQFAQKDEQGHPMQQDAEECYTNLLQAYSKGLDGIDSRETGRDIVEEMFGIKMKVTMTCDEDETISASYS